MKSVLISIQPKWCELIANGNKTVEVRKTRPNIETPFKVYIYCTKGDSLNYLRCSYFDNYQKFWVDNNAFGSNVARANGKVIGEFVCDDIKMSFVGYDEKGCPSYWDILDGTCLTPNELVCYGEWKTLYAWHISDLVIYDKPKELSEFYSLCEKENCRLCDWEREYDSCGCNRKKPIERPPQSWCYVEGGVQG